MNAHPTPPVGVEARDPMRAPEPRGGADVPRSARRPSAFSVLRVGGDVAAVYRVGA